MSEIKRQLSRLVTISALEDIPGADKIVKATVGGWQAVVQRDQFSIGEEVIYIECDAWVPTALAPFLSKGREPRKFNDVPGERLRTVKLRGTLSQGLILKVSEVLWSGNGSLLNAIRADAESKTLDEYLNIQLFEKPLPAQLTGRVRNWPSFVQKTDQERIQNIWQSIEGTSDQFEVTLKLDGSSMTVYCRDGNAGICSRNMEIELVEENEGNVFIKTAIKGNLLAALKVYCHDHKRNLAIQGELMGPNVQGNRENFTDHKFFVFDIFDIDTQTHLIPEDRHNVMIALLQQGEVSIDTNFIEHVPIMGSAWHVTSTLQGMLDLSNGKSINNALCEGLVWKNIAGGITFKVISNQFLLAEKE